MRARPFVLIVAGVAGLAAGGVLPALASDQTVTVTNFAFTPKTVTVSRDETVTWTNTQGTHHVVLDAGQAEVFTGTDGAGWTTQHKFTTAGTYTYHCGHHASMTGTVVVDNPVTTTTTTTTTTATTQTTTQTTTQQTTTQPAPAPTTTTQTSPPPVSTPKPSVTVRPIRSSFCAKAGPRCKRPGVELRVTATKLVTLTGRLTRRPLRGTGRSRSFGSVRFAARPGTRKVRFAKTRSGRRLLPGRYVLTLTGAGSYAAPITVRFRVRNS